MEKGLYDFFISKGFEVKEKKTVTQVSFENLIGFSFAFKKGEMTVKFPLFKSEDRGIHSTHKQNIQRDKFIELLKKNGDFDEKILESASPIISFESVDIFTSFIKRNKAIELVKEYTEFREVNVDFEIGEAIRDGM